MVETIKDKWCDDLEEMLQCPICMIRPRASIHQCVEGHHICMDCKKLLLICPTCSQPWCSARNRLAENLSTRLDDIKLSLIDPNGDINKIAILNKVSVETQTDETLADTVPPPEKAVDKHLGTFPCCISDCSVVLFIAPLIEHIQRDHSSQYLELEMEDASMFQHTWPVDCKEQMTLDYVFHIRGMGFYCLKLSSDVFGNLTGSVLMLHNGFISKSFIYQLEVSCCQEHTCASYTGEVCSCRTPAGVLKEKSLHVPRAEICRMTNHEKLLTCTVLLCKKPQADEAKYSKPQQQRNRYPRNRNNNAERGSVHGHPPFGGQLMPRRPMNNRQPRPGTASSGPLLSSLFAALPPCNYSTNG